MKRIKRNEVTVRKLLLLRITELENTQTFITLIHGKKHERNYANKIHISR